MSASLAILDFFCGCGGASAGFEAAGIPSVLGVDNNQAPLKTYLANHVGSKALCADITNISPAVLKSIMRNYRRKKRGVRFGWVMCPPCQDFSSLQSKSRREQDGNRRSLVMASIQLFLKCSPSFLFLENVKGFYRSPEHFSAIEALEAGGYTVYSRLLCFANYGLPQLRNRVIVVAIKKGGKPFIWPGETHTKTGGSLFADLSSWRTVRDAISNLPPLSSGQACNDDPMHKCRFLEPMSLERLRHTPEGGDWRNWPEHLLTPSKKRFKDNDLHSFLNNYGRLAWDKPSPTVLTNCISMSASRAGHPDQLRSLSLRECARLQSFPDDFFFKGSSGAIARQIGNAVPPMIARKIAECIAKAVL